MKDIKTKAGQNQARISEKPKTMPKTAMKAIWLRSREKAVARMEEEPAGKEQVSRNNPENEASRQVATAGERSVEAAYAMGRSLAESTVGRIRERRTVTRAGRGPLPAQAGAKANRQQLTRRMETLAKSAAHGAGETVQAMKAAVDKAAKGIQGLGAALAAVGGTGGLIILMICLIALVMGSCYGIFFGVQPTGQGTSVAQAVQLINGQYAEYLQEISRSVPHDREEMESNDGSLSVPWQKVLAVFSARETGEANGEQVASLSREQLDTLREIFWDMNQVEYAVSTESMEAEVTVTNGDGEEETKIQTITQEVLTISLTHKTADEMAEEYGFNDRQNQYLELMTQTGQEELWAELLGGLVDGGGEIIIPDVDWVATGALAWPLPQSYSITSPFGYREDPFTGEVDYHSGTDISAPGGTPILAAAAGTVTIANGIDSWGGSYGYHIKIDHGNGMETLYAHCSAICVRSGQQVAQGEVIGFVGSTGNSTGNHLHFEVRVGGQRTDPMSFFVGEN